MTIETNLFDTEEIHHNCMVQVLSNSITKEVSPAWKYDKERVEEILAYVCDNLCRYPAEYKDPDELWNGQCDYCRLRELLEEEGDG